MNSIKLIFLDAAGTLFRLEEPVGHTYSRFASDHNIQIDPDLLDAAFRKTWKSLSPPLLEEGTGSVDDDRSWWSELVSRTFATAHGEPLPQNVFSPLFETLYSYYANAEAWQLYDDTLEALTLMKKHFRLMVLSNFDRRLYPILAGLGIADFFEHVIISSDVGASKPHPRIFQYALDLAKVKADECLHIGDDLDADQKGAHSSGIQAIHLQRPGNDLLQIAKKVVLEAHSDLQQSA